MSARHTRNGIIALAVLALCHADNVGAENRAGFDPSHFAVEVSSMNPTAFPSRLVSYGFGLVFRNDSAFVHLPYMGCVYQLALNDDGLKFALPASDISAKWAGKSKTRVTFKVYKTPIIYRFAVTAYDNGQADIFLSPSNAQCITYYGNWIDDAEEGE